MPDILHYVRIGAAPDRVYQAISTAEGVRNWWTRDADLDQRVGGTGEFRFFDRRVSATMRVDDLAPARRVGWTTVAAQAPGGWEGTTIRFDLEPEGEGTVLHFAHRGFPEADDDYARVSTGWAQFLFSLRSYVETGRGAPHPDAELSCAPH